MSYLYQVLTQRVDAWRAANYPCDAFPAIREILEFATEDGETDQLRYLRRAQFRALETYWYLRLVLETPRIPDLYAKLFPKPKDRREAMGLSNFNVIVTNTEKIRIQKPNVRSNGQQVPLFAGTKVEEQTELANLRLQAVASLPHLAVFSDEAHHTYGQKLLGKWEKDKETGELVFKDDGIKKVRRTIDYLAEETHLAVSC